MCGKNTFFCIGQGAKNVIFPLTDALNKLPERDDLSPTSPLAELSGDSFPVGVGMMSPLRGNDDPSPMPFGDFVEKCLGGGGTPVPGALRPGRVGGGG